MAASRSDRAAASVDIAVPAVRAAPAVHDDRRDPPVTKI